MKSNTFPLLACVFSMGWLACGSSANNLSEFYTVKGKLSNSTESSIYLEKIGAKGFEPFDTATVGKDGSFAFDNKIEDIAFYRMSVAEKNYCILILEDGKKISLETDAKKLADVKNIEGSDETKLMNSLSGSARSNYLKMDSLQRVFQTQATEQNKEELSKKLGDEYNAIREQQVMIAKKFIDDHPSSFAGLSAIEMLDIEQDFTYFEVVDKELSKKYPKSEYVIAFHARVDDMRRLAIGSQAPELTMETPDGKKLSVSEFKGKVLLLDFWASWCRPCRAENPNVVKMYAKLHGKGLEILGVSLDAEKANWLKAIEADKLTWNHMSDLAQWNSAATKIYGVSGIPMTYLLDKEGKIAAKGLRGAELEKKIEELLQKN